MSARRRQHPTGTRIRSGGSLSHHHGVGKLRSGFLPRVFSPAALEWAAEIKRAVDPGNLFGIANQALRGMTRHD